MGGKDSRLIRLPPPPSLPCKILSQSPFFCSWFLQPILVLHCQNKLLYRSMSLPALFAYLLLQSVLWIQISRAFSLPPTQILGGQSPGNGILVGNFSSPNNISSLVASRPLFQCIGGADYGDNINFDSCRDAASRLLGTAGSHTRRILAFRDRNIQDAAGDADVILPYLSLSSMDFSGVIR